MKEIPSAAWCERPFPVPININARRGSEDEEDKDEEEALQSFKYRRAGDGLSINGAVRWSDVDNLRYP